MKLKNLLLTLVAVIIAILILINSSAVVSSAAAAVQNCLTNVIPSLMTFMTLAIFVSNSVCGDVLSSVLRVPVRLLFNLPENCGKVVILSMLGGYPCGAKLIADMLDRKEIDIPTAQHMMRFCVNASPAYVITAIGLGIFGNVRIGVIIWFSHIFTAIIIGFVFRSRTPTVLSQPNPLRRKISECFVESVSDSTSSMIGISGFVVTFSVILTLTAETGVLQIITDALNFVTKNTDTSRASIHILFDVVTGSTSCAECPPLTAVILCSAAVSLGGMSIWAQTAFALRKHKIRVSEIIFFRFLHAVLTATATYIIINITDTHISTAYYIYGSNPQNTSGGFLTTALFLLCCVCFVATLDKNISLILRRRKRQ